MSDGLFKWGEKLPFDLMGNYNPRMFRRSHLAQDQAYHWEAQYEDHSRNQSEIWGARWEDIDWDHIQFFYIVSTLGGWWCEETEQWVFPVIFYADFACRDENGVPIFELDDWCQAGAYIHNCEPQYACKRVSLKDEDRYKVRFYKQAHMAYDSATGKTETHIDAYVVEIGDKLSFCIKD